ncbi:hypothetical protein [Microvirga tunisiensis]|uniref:Uncharacterized protein n=1 Tax=Microvirga tunisiensis TaxID=2108360 RepID=A0A5N7MAC8_9HYPH|nr:hypothetical protein [Microvirga tunisiensis]MPR05662.1 hypothetical protein [Microvirga tunisiensis]MPR23862.1 hypothetical protein [Microvirga tunisiensis]
MPQNGPGSQKPSPTTSLMRQAEQTQRRSTRPKGLSKSLSGKIAQHLVGAPGVHRIAAENETDTFKVIKKTAEKGLLPVEAGLAGLKAGLSGSKPKSETKKEEPSPLDRIMTAYRKEMEQGPAPASKPVRTSRAKDTGTER